MKIPPHTLFYIFLLEGRRDYKLEMCHTFLESKLGIMIQIDKGFLRVGWGKSISTVKPKIPREVDLAFLDPKMVSSEVQVDMSRS